MSMPRSRARRRASGDALIRPLLVVGGAGGAATGVSDTTVSDTFSGSGAAGASTDTSSPGSPMNAIVCPTGASPSGNAIFSSTPAKSDSTSCVTLSVSIS